MNSSDLILSDQTEKIFKIENEPDTIQFKINSSFSYNNIDINSSTNTTSLLLTSQTEINIRNISNEFICFRIQSTKPTNYKINPDYSILTPKKILNIKIYFYIDQKEKINPSEHKFKFEGFIISEKEKNKEPKNLLLFYHNLNFNIYELYLKKKKS